MRISFTLDVTLDDALRRAYAPLAREPCEYWTPHELEVELVLGGESPPVERFDASVDAGSATGVVNQMVYCYRAPDLEAPVGVECVNLLAVIALLRDFASDRVELQQAGGLRVFRKRSGGSADTVMMFGRWFTMARVHTDAILEVVQSKPEMVRDLTVGANWSRAIRYLMRFESLRTGDLALDSILSSIKRPTLDGGRATKLRATWPFQPEDQQRLLIPRGSSHAPSGMSQDKDGISHAPLPQTPATLAVTTDDLQRLVDAVPFPAFVTDHQDPLPDRCTILACNEQVMALYGMSRALIVGFAASALVNRARLHYGIEWQEQKETLGAAAVGADVAFLPPQMVNASRIPLNDFEVQSGLDSEAATLERQRLADLREGLWGPAREPFGLLAVATRLYMDGSKRHNGRATNWLIIYYEPDERHAFDAFMMSWRRSLGRPLSQGSYVPKRVPTNDPRSGLDTLLSLPNIRVRAEKAGGIRPGSPSLIRWFAPTFAMLRPSPTRPGGWLENLLLDLVLQYQADRRDLTIRLLSLHPGARLPADIASAYRSPSEGDVRERALHHVRELRRLRASGHATVRQAIDDGTISARVCRVTPTWGLLSTDEMARVEFYSRLNASKLEERPQLFFSFPHEQAGAKWWTDQFDWMWEGTEESSEWANDACTSAAPLTEDAFTLDLEVLKSRMQ